MKSMKNKKLGIPVLAAFLLTPFVALAGEVYPKALDEKGFSTAIANILNTVSLLFGAFAVIMFLTTGFLFLMGRGDPNKTAEARKAFLWGVIGVIVALLSFGMATEIGRILGV